MLLSKLFLCLAVPDKLVCLLLLAVLLNFAGLFPVAGLWLYLAVRPELYLVLPFWWSIRFA